MRKSQRTAKGKWVFVPVSKDVSPEELEREKMDEVSSIVSLGWSKEHPFAPAEEFTNYFPGDNKVPDGGAWILVKHPPSTEYTVPPLSIWFAEPWPMDNEKHSSHRVKIMTPKGELGLFPREYSLIKEPQKYYEFIGDGMEIHFFGNEEGVPKDALFYLRSRGISKKDALCMLISEVKAHGVMWVESAIEIQKMFCRSLPSRERLATV